MAKVERLDLVKARKKGNITPEVLHDTIGKWIEGGRLEGVITVLLSKDGDVSVGHTNMKLSEVIGLLELAKTRILIDQEIL